MSVRVWNPISALRLNFAGYLATGLKITTKWWHDYRKWNDYRSWKKITSIPKILKGCYFQMPGLSPTDVNSENL